MRTNQAAAAHLVTLIRSNPSSSYYWDENANERAEQAASRFLYGLTKSDYNTARPSLLRIALDEAVDPDSLAQCADAMAPGRTLGGSWTEASSSDISLHGVYHAYRTIYG